MRSCNYKLILTDQRLNISLRVIVGIVFGVVSIDAARAGESLGRLWRR